MIELALGEPDPVLLPREPLKLAAERVLGTPGGVALNYGAPRGPGPLISWLAAWLSEREGRLIDPGRMMITGGVSAALTQVCLALSEPGGVALCESPTYHLAGQIFRDYGLEPRAIAVDGDGIVPADLDARIAAARASGRPVSLVYTVPSHNNPTGRTTTAERRRELVAVTREQGVPLIEDDPYREVFFDSAPPPLGNLEEESHVIRLGSFSKLLAPGLRLGWLVAGTELVGDLLSAGWLDSGGGPNHLTAMIVHQLAVEGGLDRNLSVIVPAYAERAEALVTELGKVLPRGSRFELPTGGFFVWVRLPDRFNTRDLLPRAERLGVSFAPGARFGVPGAPQPVNAMRLGFCGHSPEELREGARRLGRALDG